ncbi:MAG: amidohydrolase family protein [Acidobacteriota bacterium]
MKNWQLLLQMLGIGLVLGASAWVTGLDGGLRDDGWNPKDFDRIDIHTHFYQDQPFILPVLDAFNIRRTAILCALGMDNPSMLKEYEERIVAMRDRYPERFVFCPTIDISRIDEGNYVAQVLDHLEMNVRRGAKGIKIWKVLGMGVKDQRGCFVAIDDKRLEPIWKRFAELELPVIIHAAEPIEAWLKLDPASPHYGYFSKNPEWHFYDKPGVYSHAQLMQQRDNVVARHPDLTVIGNHFGSLEHDLEGLSRRFSKYSNFYAETGARFVNFVRHPPEIMRAFFIKHQDRLLFGSDITTLPPGNTESDYNAERERHFRRWYADQFRYLETNDEVTFGGVTSRGLKLPQQVLQKLYFDNAKRLIPGI